jgi:hypothetical protein
VGTPQGGIFVEHVAVTVVVGQVGRVGAALSPQLDEYVGKFENRSPVTR